MGGIFAARIMAGFGFKLARKAVQNYRNLRETMTSYDAVKQRLTSADVPRASLMPDTMEAPLVLNDVNFRHRNARNDLYRSLSLSLGVGELLVINGTAGTGKSTLSRLLVGILQPRHGQIRLGDVELSRLPADIRADLIGYMPQHTELFSGTVRDNIARMGDGAFEEVVAAAKLVGIHNMIVRLSDGYVTQITSDNFGLSGSERKRISLAREFYRCPRILVLDEPSANLDAPSRRIMESALKTLKAQGSSIIITQSIHSAQITRMADRFLILGGKSHEVTENLDRKTAERVRASEERELTQTGNKTTGWALPHIDDRQPFGRKLGLIGFGIIAVFCGTFYVWASSAPIEGAVIAPGVVSVDTNMRTIKHLEGGIIDRILVRESDRVESGQVLITLQNTVSASSQTRFRPSISKPGPPRPVWPPSRPDLTKSSFPRNWRRKWATNLPAR